MENLWLEMTLITRSHVVLIFLLTYLYAKNKKTAMKNMLTL